MVLDLLNKGVVSTQDIIEESQIEAAQLASILSLMEITGKIRSMGGGQWIVV